MILHNSVHRFRAWPICSVRMVAFDLLILIQGAKATELRNMSRTIWTPQLGRRRFGARQLGAMPFGGRRFVGR